jgi:hypothetical protein
MITHKKSDLWKAGILIALIVATFWFSFRTIMKAGSPPPTVNADQQAGSQPAGQAIISAGNEMFAPRDHAVTQLIARARSVADPFRPYASMLPAPATNAPAVSPAPQSRPRAAPPKAETETRLRLVGLVSGVRPTAVLISDDGHHYARAGDSLPGGWRLAEVSQGSVVLTKGKERARLLLRKQDGKSPK